ncbi:hypothetical protein IAR55_002639 [Kwoniella newhampshirensis]|uniref:RNA helicase n=1 Tax=Kwoniella newhampshirensis TaxID=1651941 RepID=A0AAW0YNA6_9TREE
MSLSRAGPSVRPICRRCLLARRISIPYLSQSTPRHLFTSTNPSREVPSSPSSSFLRKPPSNSSRSAFRNDRRPPRSGSFNREPIQLSVSDFDAKPPPKPRQLLRALLARIPEWITSPRARVKLEAYGLNSSDILPLCRDWLEEVKTQLKGCENDEMAQKALEAGGWNTEDLLIAMAEERLFTALEASALRRFLQFCVASPGGLSESKRTHLRAILETTDLSRLAYSTDHLAARSMTRHFHLHIGPTNSGKTYNALKALSRAKSGAYAGPLRLLAHEVWERMNLGTVGDLDGKGKKCNLLTGEERRVVDPDAGLLSCTVEMLPLAGLQGQGFDVVVIDEIQMLGDGQRGGSWTKAVLGVAAKEVHLCGDETTVELLKSIVATLGDKITIHQYNRLTPLTVAEESLGNEYKDVQEGDCIVTFSRTNIFNVKKQVESTAGKKCAVVYGALPPETRAEQARDFNDENGVSKVLVASDAVGMGLNLKIKRIIFESLSKFNGKTEVPLALTQIKQIAGRAGRFKTANDSKTPVDGTSTPDETPATGGLVTTLRDADLPILRELINRSLPSIPRANLEVPHVNLADLAALLPAGTSFAALLEHFAALAQPPPKTVLAAHEHKLPLADLVEPLRDELSLTEIDLFCFAPVNIRDERAKGIFRTLVEDFAGSGVVEIEEILEESDLLGTLEEVEEALRTLPPLPPAGSSERQFVPQVMISSLPMLETLHKSLVLYIWLSFRLEVAFPDRAKAVEYKTRTEKVLEECLERLPGLKKKKGIKGKGKGRNEEMKNWVRERLQRGPTEVVKQEVIWLDGNEVRKEKQRKIWKNVAMLEEGDVGAGGTKRL